MDGDAHAGWYPDPTGRSEFRYWDGAEWTEHVSRAGQQSIDPLDLAIAPGDEGTGVDPAEELAPTTTTAAASPTAAAGSTPDDATTLEQNPAEPLRAPMPLADEMSESVVAVPVSSSQATQRRHWPWIALGVAAALLVGFGIGALTTSNKDQVDHLKKQLATATRERDVAQAKVNNRESRRRANLASVAAAKAAKDAADRRAVAKAAADAKAAAAKQAAAAKAAADAQAAAAAAAAAEAAKKDTFTGDGVRAVGPEINPGLWHTDGGVENCYYAILNSTDTTNIADNNNTTGPASVTLPAGKYFQTSGCADWHRVG